MGQRSSELPASIPTRNTVTDASVRASVMSGPLRAGGLNMAKGEQRGNREAKKPKKEKQKVSAAASSLKGFMQSDAAKTRKK